MVHVLLTFGLLWSQESSPVPAWRQVLNRAAYAMNVGSPETAGIFQEAFGQAERVADGGLAKAIVSSFYSMILTRQERYGESEQMLRAAMAVFNRYPREAGGEHVAALNNLAYVLHQTGRREEELKCLHLAMERAERIRPVDPMMVVPILGNLAMLYVESGDFRHAREVLDKAVPYENDSRVAQHRYRMPLLNAASEFHLERGETREALEKAALSVKIAEQSREGESAELSGPLHQLARVELAMGRLSAAERHWKQRLAIIRQQRSKDYPHLASILVPLASLARLQGRDAEAEEMLREAGRIAELSRRNAVLAVVQHEMALLEVNRKRFVKAEPLFRSSLALTANAIGTRNNEYARCLSDFAATLAAMRKYEAAEAALGEAIRTTEQIRTRPDPMLPAMLNTHAKLLVKLKRKDEARQVQARAQALRAAGASEGFGQTVDVLELK
ncbi:MAG: tetratricopeptide repeat protein [Bryobacteraceae bacterium]